MSEEAVLLTDGSVSLENNNIAKILRFFGVPWRNLTMREFLARESPAHKASLKSRLICSVEVFSRLIEESERSAERVRLWQEGVHSAFIYAGEDSCMLQKFLRCITSDPQASLREMNAGAAEWVISDNLVEFCGIMSGIRMHAAATALEPGFVFDKSNGNTIAIISTDRGATFLKVEHHSVPIFFSTFGKIIDIDTGLRAGNFDVRNHIRSAVPVVLYIQWAFPETCWNTPEVNACLVIDDALLKPSYGFVNFQELLGLMERHRFSTNIAFIPWNWRRSDPEVVRLFKQHPDKYSLSIHGCDHASAEFGSHDRDRLRSMARQAADRMSGHESKTHLRYERIMVFPQGVFSEAAIGVLKHTNFTAVVNTEVIGTPPQTTTVRISDVWDVAVMRYDSFPIFTRRYPTQGMENFAFDILLGKPCIAVIHHDFCCDGCARLVEFIDRLNALKCPLSWRGLGEVVQRSYRQRELSSGAVEVEMYGTELRVKNRSEKQKRFIIRRREFDPSAIKEIRAESDQIAWNFSEGRIAFEIELNPGESRTIGITFHDLSGNGRYIENAGYKVKTLLRRYLSEAQDNWFMTTKSWLLGLGWKIESRGQRSEDRGRERGTEVRDEMHATNIASSLADRVTSVLANFTEWLRVFGETSWDHQSFYAGSYGVRAKALYYRHRILGTAAVVPIIFSEAFLPSARRLFHHPIRFPIADAHYAMGFAFLYETTLTPAYLEKAVHFLTVLAETRSPQSTEYCWGYPFDWVTRNGVIKRQTPLITTTPYIYEAFLHVYALDPREEWKQIFESTARHAAINIKDFRTSETASSCSYTPYDSGGVINAAAYRASLLTSASRVFSNDDYWKIAERNLNFVLENQNPDGSWYYALDGVRDFVDHFHTCFVMKALAKIHALTRHEACGTALAKGVAYYQKNLFDQRGLPKPFSKAPRLTVYKRELYDCAECINLCLLLRDRFPQLETTLKTVVEGILKDWIKPDGSFRSRRLHLGWDNVPMHRWGQSQMFRSLAFYVREASERRDQVSEISSLKLGENRNSDRVSKGSDRFSESVRAQKNDGVFWGK